MKVYFIKICMFSPPYKLKSLYIKSVVTKQIVFFFKIEYFSRYLCSNSLKTLKFLSVPHIIMGVRGKTEQEDQNRPDHYSYRTGGVGKQKVANQQGTFLAEATEGVC